MGLELDYINGQTALDEDEKEGLKVLSISTRGDLNEFEQQNIQKAVEWTLYRKFKVEEVLSEKFVKALHKRMFWDVWKWAGSFRDSNKNLGVDKYLIGVELQKLLDDCSFWISKKTFNTDEIAVRFSHRIVAIHCFANGNGRHSRLIADILINILGNEVFTWGRGNLTQTSELRKKYIDALKAADEGDYSLLIKFARL